MAASQANPEYTPSAISATAQVKNSPGLLGSVFCSSTSSGTITIYDNAASSASGSPVVATYNLTAGVSNRFDMKFVQGLYVVIGGTASVTVFYN